MRAALTGPLVSKYLAMRAGVPSRSALSESFSHVILTLSHPRLEICLDKHFGEYIHRSCALSESLRVL